MEVDLLDLRIWNTGTGTEMQPRKGEAEAKQATESEARGTLAFTWHTSSARGITRMRETRAERGTSRCRNSRVPSSWSASNSRSWTN